MSGGEHVGLQELLQGEPGVVDSGLQECSLLETARMEKLSGYLFSDG